MADTRRSHSLSGSSKLLLGTKLFAPAARPGLVSRPRLIEQLDAGLSARLILDDYHTITEPAIHRAVAFLLERLPPKMHLVISTRSDPPFPLARLRSHGQMLEVRADALRFTPEEASAFLNSAMGIALPQGHVSALGAGLPCSL